MGDRDVAARGQRVTERRDDPWRVVVLGEEVQHGDEQHGDRLTEVEVGPYVGVGQDARGLAGVPSDGDGPLVAGQQSPGVNQHDLVVIDVDHPRVRVDALGDLVDVPGRGKA
jgi:hypothetical protein